MKAEKKRSKSREREAKKERTRSKEREKFARKKAHTISNVPSPKPGKKQQEKNFIFFYHQMKIIALAHIWGNNPKDWRGRFHKELGLFLT